MKNPFYTRRQERMAKSIALQLLSIFVILLLLKLQPEGPCSWWSWWTITLPITLPVAMLFIAYITALSLHLIDKQIYHEDELL